MTLPLNSSQRGMAKELSDKLNNDLLGEANWLHDHKLTLNLDKTKCMLGKGVE